MRTLVSRFKKRKEYVVTIGVFDGVHKGHAYLLNKLIQASHTLGVPSLLITFWPHPEYVLNKKKFNGCITALKQKEELLNSSGLDYFFILHTTSKLLQLGGESFLKKILRFVTIKKMIVGDDFRFGYKAESTVGDLKKLSKKFGFGLKIVRKKMIHNHIVSSSFIRKLIAEGKVDEVRAFLGRHFCLEGKIVKGKGLGAKIGYPTINVEFGDTVLPKNGVYAVKVLLGEVFYLGACDIGYAPTLSKAQKKAVEIHLLRCKKIPYRKKIQIIFLERIRDEKKFASCDELKTAICDDILFITSKYNKKI